MNWMRFVNPSVVLILPSQHIISYATETLPINYNFIDSTNRYGMVIQIKSSLVRCFWLEVREGNSQLTMSFYSFKNHWKSVGIQPTIDWHNHSNVYEFALEHLLKREGDAIVFYVPAACMYSHSWCNLSILIFHDGIFFLRTFIPTFSILNVLTAYECTKVQLKLRLRAYDMTCSTVLLHNMYGKNILNVGNYSRMYSLHQQTLIPNNEMLVNITYSVSLVKWYSRKIFATFGRFSTV